MSVLVEKETGQGAPAEAGCSLLQLVRSTKCFVAFMIRCSAGLTACAIRSHSSRGSWWRGEAVKLFTPEFKIEKDAPFLAGERLENFYFCLE